MNKNTRLWGILFISLLVIGCAKKKPPVVEIVEEPVIEEVVPVDTMPTLDQITAKLSTIYFDFDKYAIRDTDAEILNSNARVLKAYPDVKIVIEGHCDERGTAEYNMALGERRAKSAIDFLITIGIKEARLTTVSYGKENPVDMGNNEEAWAKNRRAEFKVR